MDTPDNRNQKKLSESHLYNIKSIESSDNPVVTATKKNRRKLLKLLGIGAIIYTAADYENVFSFVGYHAYNSPVYIHDIATSDDYDEQVKRDIKHLEDRYKCDVEFSTMGEVNLSKKKEMLQKLNEILEKYPPEFIQKLGIKFNFQWEYDDSNKAETDIVDGIITVFTNVHISYTSIAHEIHHMAESRLFNCEESNDWISLNPNGANDYIGDEWRKYEMDPPIDGFFMHYQRCNCHEDQARIVEGLFATAAKPDLYEEVEKTFKEAGVNYTTYARKIEKIKNYYEKWTNGKMNSQYWEDLKAGKVNEEYWK